MPHGRTPRRLTATVAAAVSVLTLAGCGGTSTDAGSTVAGTSAPSALTTSSAPLSSVTPPGAAPGPTPGEASTAEPRPTVLDADVQARIDELVTTAMTGAGLPGVSVALIDPALGRYEKSYGFADLGNGTAMTGDLHYRIASVTKTFTADAVLKLVDRGVISLDDPVSKYVDGVPNGDLITVRLMLAMRSGVYDYTSDPAFGEAYTADPRYALWTVNDALSIMQRHAADFAPPDTRTVYADSNYVLLGMVLEKATGRPVHEVLTDLAASMGLTGTSFPTADGLPVPFASGYTDPLPGGGATPQPPTGATPTGTPGADLRNVTANNPLVPWTAGAMVSTAGDMAAYARLLAAGGGLSAATAAARQEWTPLTTEGVRVQYGLGVLRLGDWVGHDGAILGYSNLAFYLPTHDAVLVVAANRGTNSEVAAQSVFGAIVQYLYPDSLPTW